MTDDDSFWRVTAMPARFPGIPVDARAALFIPLVLLWFRPWTIGLFLVVMVILWLLERRGYSVPVALRMLMLWIALRFRTEGHISYGQRWRYRFFHGSRG